MAEGMGHWFWASSRRRRLVALGATLHLVVVAYCGFKRHWLTWTPARRAVAVYAGYTGASTQYGFFAPNVGTQFHAIFDVVEADGRTSREELPTPGNHEAEIRVSNVVGLYGSAIDNEPLRRSLVASWVGDVLGRHPGARAVDVRIESYDLPSSHDYRDGARPKWAEIYRARFTPDGPA